MLLLLLLLQLLLLLLLLLGAQHNMSTDCNYNYIPHANAVSLAVYRLLLHCCRLLLLLAVAVGYRTLHTLHIRCLCCNL